MKILIIGGTYFLGKAFTNLLAEKKNQGENVEIYLLNRGNNLPEDKEIFSGLFIADRHDEERLSKINDSFDVIVDFCAYHEGDIKMIMRHIETKHYIFISTTDVYRRGTGCELNEDAELEDRDFGGEAGEYILGKVSLENELRHIAAYHKEIRFTVLRPVFIYGSGNYAPRESMYFKWMTGAGQILHPSDSDGHFQMVYVKDVAKAIWLTVSEGENFDDNVASGDDKRTDGNIYRNQNYNLHAYNVCDNSVIDYEAYAELMNNVSKKCLGKELQKVEITVSEIEERGIPLPFPLTKGESEHYLGDRIKTLGFMPTDMNEAMAETFLSYVNDMRE